MEENCTKRHSEALKGIADSVRRSANWFDESHEYERMNDLDRAAMVLKALVPVVEALSEDAESGAEFEKEFGEKPSYSAIPRESAEQLLAAIADAAQMEPFAVKMDGVESSEGFCGNCGRPTGPSDTICSHCRLTVFDGPDLYDAETC